MPNYSLVENLDWLRENKQLFIETLDSKLDSPSGLTIHTSWDDIVAYINNLPTYIMDLVDGAIEELERFLGNNIEKTIQVTSNKIVPYAFKEKSSIKNFIGNNVTTVGDYAFQNCTNLESFKGTSVTSIGSYAFHNTKIKTISDMPSLSTIGSYAFQNCNELTEVNLVGINTVNSYAFIINSGTPKLTSIIFGANTAIGDYAFAGHTQLNSTLYLNCKSIGQYAFQSCSSIREIIVTTDVKTMSAYALYNIGSVGRILCEAPSKPSGWHSYWNYGNYPAYWNCIERDWVFKYNSTQEDTTFHGRIIDTLPTPEPKEGYEFDCWYTDNTLATKVTTPFALPNGNYPVLYAGWKIALHVFTYNTETEILSDLGYRSFKSLEEIQAFKTDITIDHIYLDAEYTQELTNFEQLQGYAGEPIYLVGVTRVEYTFEYTGHVQEATLSSGHWLIECWGAQGTYATNNPNGDIQNGKGGYSRGTLTLTDSLRLFLYVGGKSADAVAGGWNGGGASYRGSSYNDNGPGGGASDVSLVGGDCHTDSYKRYIRTSESYLARLLVAGGGGGGRNCSSEFCRGGYAPAINITGSSGAASINSGGASSGSSVSSGFGFGASGTSTGDDTAGGGGGWYGGGSQGDSYGGGGSSFAWCEQYQAYVPNNYSVPENLKLTDVLLVAGNYSMPSPTNIDETEIGHSGNGYIRITKIRQV